MKLTDEKLTNWLIRNDFSGININEKNSESLTPLMVSIKQNNDSITELILDTNCLDINRKNDDLNNALWFSTIECNLEISRKLIEYGISIDNQNTNGVTPLIYASAHNQLEILKLLLSFKADANIKTIDDFTALDLASSKDIYQILKEYLKNI
jgi:ankyrin repeat protein